MRKRVVLFIFLFFCLSGLSSLVCAQENVGAQDDFPFVAEVSTKKLNIRAGQSSGFEKVGLLKQGDEVVVVGKSYSWYKIKLPLDAKIYISAKYIKMLGNDIGEVTGSRLNIRAGKGSNFSVVGQLKKGELVRVLEKSSEWFRIEPAEQGYGWVLAEHVQFESRNIPSPRIVQIPEPTPVVEEVVAEPVVKPARLTAVGVVESMGGQALSSDIRHQIAIDEDTVYFLQGYRRIIDSFLNNRVSVEGEIQEDVNAPHPVILVTKIKLIL